MKNMILLWSAFAYSLAAILSPSDTTVSDTYMVNAEESKIEWQAYKVGGKHNGTVMLKEGKLEFEDGSLQGGMFVIDMQTITVLDLEGEWKDKLEGHLRSEDFFGVETYNTATFTITQAFPIGTEGKYRIKGDVTIKDKTDEIAFNAMISEEGNQLVATADIKIDRSKFNVRYGSGSFFSNLGDKTIYDEFDLSITLKAQK